MPLYIHLFGILLILTTYFPCVSPAFISDEHKLYDHVFKGYNHTKLRPLKHKGSIMVTLDVEFIQIVVVDERRQALTVKIWR